jgi:hypothetical protein
VPDEGTVVADGDEAGAWRLAPAGLAGVVAVRRTTIVGHAIDADLR